MKYTATILALASIGAADAARAQTVRAELTYQAPVEGQAAINSGFVGVKIDVDIEKALVAKFLTVKK